MGNLLSNVRGTANSHSGNLAWVSDNLGASPRFGSSSLGLRRLCSGGNKAGVLSSLELKSMGFVRNPWEDQIWTFALLSFYGGFFFINQISCRIKAAMSGCPESTPSCCSWSTSSQTRRKALSWSWGFKELAILQLITLRIFKASDA